MNYIPNSALVAYMNESFGNPKGHATAIDWDRIAKQSLNIADELAEVFAALGADPAPARAAAQSFKSTLEGLRIVGQGAGVLADLPGVRDGLCDIHVFAYGAHHLMGINPDTDMRVVIDGVMTRFIKDEADKAATVEMHAAKGVADVYFEGSYPTMVMKSASDQPDAPKGKFLKSASFVAPTFPDAS